MRSVIALPALFVVAARAQVESFSFATTQVTTTAEDVQPTVTETLSGPIETAKACGQIARLVGGTSFDYPSVEAELAYACLKSVPIDNDAASQTITELKKMLEFQSTLSYIKDPPQGYFNEGVDLMSGLDDIGKNINDSKYDNEYDFENDIASLFVKAHDGHLSFIGMAYHGTLRWRRNSEIALISASSDGSEIPKVWAAQDFNHTGSAGFTPSAVSQIDGKDAVDFLQEESLLSSYHDPDTRYNAMFYMQSAENYGYFTNPRFYPGPSVNVTFENGTSNTYPNAAIVLDPYYWDEITDGDDFYSMFIYPTSGGFKRLSKRMAPNSLPYQLQNHREAEFDHAYVPVKYPDPVIEHTAVDVPLAGFFVDSPAGKVGVLMAQTFNTEGSSDAREFQRVVEDYISQAKDEGVEKHIIDLRANGGGKILLGYDMYLQFFPSQEPQLLSRYRGHRASELMGDTLSSMSSLNSLSGALYTSPFNYHSYLDKDNEDFTSWDDMYPPVKFKDDNFTDLVRYNLSDPLTTSSSTYSIGVTMTGYGSRSDFTEDPFKAEDIIILSDGICASTCSLFTELMVQQSGVKTLALGGRPLEGPMQPVGGTKGSLVLQNEYLSSISDFVTLNFPSDNSNSDEWTDYLPGEFGVMAADASINFQDNIRKGLEKDGIPTQFLNDSASCRIWYQPEFYVNVTALWSKAAEVAFGKDGGLDEGACIKGSVTDQKAQQGQGEGSPTSGGGDGNAQPSSTTSKAAAAGLVRPAEGGWTAIAVCATVVLSSMAFGASLI